MRVEAMLRALLRHHPHYNQEFTRVAPRIVLCEEQILAGVLCRLGWQGLRL